MLTRHIKSLSERRSQQNSSLIKSLVAEITDSTNVARAYSFVPITWFLGASIGLVSTYLFCETCHLTTSRPFVGGMLERPA